MFNLYILYCKLRSFLFFRKDIHGYKVLIPKKNFPSVLHGLNKEKWRPKFNESWYYSTYNDTDFVESTTIKHS